MVRYLEIFPPLRWWIICGFLWLMSASAAFAGQSGRVIRIGASQTNIAISHPQGSFWQVRDRVCVMSQKNMVVCGRVLKATSKGAIVKLDSPSSDFITGDAIVAESQAGGVTSDQNRRPASLPKAQLLDSVKKHVGSDEYHYNLSAGTSISFSFFYPILNFQFSTSPQWAIGLMPMALFASSNGANLTGIGGYGTLNYYSAGHFRGLWIQAGGGMVAFSVSGGPVSESAISLSAISTLGWRGYWDLGLNIGVGAGVQYIQSPTFTSITVGSAGFLPLVILDVGFNW